MGESRASAGEGAGDGGAAAPDQRLAPGQTDATHRFGRDLTGEHGVDVVGRMGAKQRVAGDRPGWVECCAAKDAVPVDDRA